MMNMNTITNNLAILIMTVAAVCTLVSVITQLTKEIGVLERIPTALEVLVLSIVLTVIAFFAYVQYAKINVTWYMIVAAVLAGFVIAFITLNGWDKLTDIWKRFYRKEK